MTWDALQGYLVDWAIAHPVIAFFQALLVLSVISRLPTIVSLIPGAIEELREKREAKRRFIEDERRRTYEGPWS